MAERFPFTALAASGLFALALFARDARACKCVDQFQDLEIRIESVEVDGVALSDTSPYEWDRVLLQRYEAGEVMLTAFSDDGSSRYEERYEVR